MKNTIYTNAKTCLTSVAKEVKRTTSKSDKLYINQTINDQLDSMVRQVNFWAMKGRISEKQAALYCKWLDAHAHNLQS